MASRLKAIWIFFVGLIVILVGFFLFFFQYLNQQYSFILMLGGLLISGLGSIYGRKKLMGAQNSISPGSENNAGSVPVRSDNLSDLLKGIDKNYKPKQNFVQASAVKQVVTQPVDSQPTEEETQQFPVQQKPQKPEPEPQRPDRQPPSPTSPYYRDFVQKVIKVYVCPKCGTENEEKNIFCFKCGKKIRMTSNINTKAASSKK